MLGEHGAVVRLDRTDDRLVGQVGLDDDAARVLTATGATGDLFEQVERALARSEIGHLEGVVGVDHAHERHLGEVQALGDHLRAEQHRALSGVELLK